MTESSSSANEPKPSKPCGASDATTPTGDTCTPTSVPTDPTGTSDIHLEDASDDVVESSRDAYAWLAAFDAHVEHEELLQIRPGDDKHPLNVAKIKEGMGCIDGLCEVEIKAPPYQYQYVVRHTTPAHERTYTVRDRWTGAIKKQVTQQFDQRNSQMAIDPWIMRKLEDRQAIADAVIRRMRDEWQHHWPQHA